MERKNINRVFKSPQFRPWFRPRISLLLCELQTSGSNFRIVIMMNRQAGLNLLVRSATEAIQQWARDIKRMRMGILIVIHTYKNIQGEIVKIDPQTLGPDTKVIRF